MNAIYNNAFRVPIWVIVKQGPHQAAIIEAFQQAGSYLQDWPSFTFINTIKKMANAGWKHVVGQKKPYTVSIPFCCAASAAHIKACLGINRLLSGHPIRPYSTGLNRKITTDEDYASLFDQMLSLEDDLTLSQLFGVGERCHYPETKVYVYCTPEPANESIIKRISEQVVVVKGKAPACAEGLDPLEQYKQTLLSKVEEEVKKFVNSH